jgi:hypothetical protein
MSRPFRVMTTAALAGASLYVTASAATVHAAGPGSPAPQAQDPVTTVIQAYLCTWAWLGPDAHGGPIDVVTCEIANARAGT